MKNWGKQIFLVLVIIAILVVQTNFVLAQITGDIDISDSDIELGDLVDISINIDSTNETIESVEIDFDNGDIRGPLLSGPDHFDKDFNDYEYDETGSYTITVIINTNNDTITLTQDIDIDEVEIQDDDPDLTLISPSANKLLKADSVDFVFTATDDFWLSQCSFELYLQDGSFKELQYESDVNDPAIGSEMTVKLEEFEDGNYTWYVTCIDNRSQDTTDTRSFSIQTTSHDRQKEIEQLLVDIDDFMKKEDSLTPEEKDAISELKISEDLTYYKKRLLQIDQDLGNNIKLIADSILKEKRRIETLEELDKIVEEIPKDIEIIKSDEYIKNSLTPLLSEIIESYTTEKRIILSPGKIRRLSKLNSEIQESITTSTSIKAILISYQNRDEEITIIKKDIKITNPSFKKILEVFPAGFDEDIIFVTKVGKITDSIYEINLDDLDEDEIIYYIETEVSLNKIKDTETLIFEEFPTSGSFITGFSIFSGESTTQSYYIGISVLIFILSGFIFVKKKNTKYHKNGKGSSKIISLIKSARVGIKENRFDSAIEKYHEIKKLYPAASDKLKILLFRKIEKIKIDIDKEEMKNLIKEYEKSKRKNDIKTSHAIYNKIKTKYTCLPKQYQGKVYDWITQKI